MVDLTTYLPLPIKDEILYFLDYNSIANMCTTNKTWENRCKQPGFWSHILQLRYPQIAGFISGTDVDPHYILKALGSGNPVILFYNYDDIVYVTSGNPDFVNGFITGFALMRTYRVDNTTILYPDGDILDSKLRWDIINDISDKFIFEVVDSNPDFAYNAAMYFLYGREYIEAIRSPYMGDSLQSFIEGLEEVASVTDTPITFDDDLDELEEELAMLQKDLDEYGNFIE